MRVISGKHRGKKLLSPKHNIRPTLDKVKQAIFTRLQFQINGARVLDLFAGSGALGIEALSRNAGEVIFCDSDKQSAQLIKENLKAVKEEAKVIIADYKTALKTLDGKFDLILLDPPYKAGYYDDALQIIWDRNLLSEDGVIVCEREKNEKINNQVFELDCSKFYGSVAVDYFIKRNR